MELTEEIVSKGDGTEASVSVVDKHVRQRGGRTDKNRRSRKILGYTLRE